MKPAPSVLQSTLFRYVLLITAVYLTLSGLYYAGGLLAPLSTAGLLAMLMLPICRQLERWKLPRVAAIIICLLIILIVVLGIGALLSTQIMGFLRDLPTLQAQMTTKLATIQQSIRELTDVSADEQIQFLRDRLNSLLGSAGRYLMAVLTTTGNALTTIGLVLIYTFFFLFYRQRFVRFILMITPPEHHRTTRDIITQVGQVTQQYMSGVLLVMIILATLNTIGLSIIGIQQAVFFGVLGGLLNIIPYIGTFLGGLIPTLFALLTKESITPAIAVAAVFSLNQFLENNFLTPFIVGGRVKVNPLATIIALLIGSYVWGIAGMILFIPLLGITKIILDNVKPLRPFGYLVGEEDDDDETGDKQATDQN
ncbi:UPF0118 membrane protein [Fibrisoma limi BUZ 3]|uniref:UPF0118 membrane protein n=1 Tax=Fibrisoma limi BUZ 3 TaxID=1185876 RepID=I2GPW4_9BACT|nr:AI-2E family transporter [Fibrisoma limi]CCH55942.1 UPF0118 membrane protein [Fibrisoma limi BUZ 3]